MGADMTIAICRDIHYSKPAQRWLGERLVDRTNHGLSMQRSAALTNLLAEARILALDPLPNNYEDLFFWHSTFYDRADEATEPTFTDDEVREMIRDGVAQVFESWRDTTTLFIDNKYWIATGGLSWGDPPTEAYDPVGMLDGLRLFDKAITIAELRVAWAQLPDELKEPA